MDKKNIETILPLTALQQGFLWHSLSSAEAPGAGLIQMQCHLAGQVDQALFTTAWQQTVEHHQMLRASVHWENVKKPVMVVHRQVFATVAHHDWRESACETRSLQEFLSSDIDAGLPIDRAPVSRVALIQLDDHAYKLVWTSHHLLLDGWSGGLILDELFARYDCLTSRTVFTANLPPAFAGYLKWLQSQDQIAAKRYWSELLSGYETGRSLPRSGKPVVCEVQLDRAATESVNVALRDLRTTLSALIQSAWACLMSQGAIRSDVVFGATISGRQNNYPQADRLVGMFVNVLPVRVFVDPAQTVSELLQAVQAQSFASLPHAYADIGQIQTWSECSGELFDTLLTVENQPSGQSSTSLAVSDRHSGIVSAYGVTVIVRPGAELTFSLHTSEGLMSADQATALLNGLRTVMVQMISAPEQPVRELASTSDSFADLWVAKLPANSLVVPEDTDRVPIGLLEQRLSNIWREVLGVASVTSTDSFFDLGGTSILATVLFNRISAEIGVQLPTTTLFQHNSIQSLIDLLAQNQEAAIGVDTVVIQPDGDKPPLFIPDTATDLLVYRHLAGELGRSQPIYGFRARELTHLSFGELAARLNRQLLAVQPNGPFYLAGMSGAGSLAWMMAQQLRHQGHDVAMLILFDCLGPDYPQLQSPIGRIGSSLYGAARVVSRRLIRPEQDKLLRNTDPVGLNATAGSQGSAPSRSARLMGLVRVLTKGRPLIEKIANLTVMLTLKIPAQSNLLAWAAFMQGLWLEHKANPTLLGEPIEEPIRIAGDVYERLYGELEIYNGRIEFFWARERPPATVQDEYSGWRSIVAGEFSVHKVPGNHLSLIEPPNVRELARALESLLGEPQPACKPQV